MLAGLTKGTSSASRRLGHTCPSSEARPLASMPMRSCIPSTIIACSLALGCAVRPGAATGQSCVPPDDVHADRVPAISEADARAPGAILVVRFKHAANVGEIRDALEAVRGCVLGGEDGFLYVRTDAWVPGATSVDSSAAVLRRTPAIGYVELYPEHRSLRAHTPWVPSRPPDMWLIPADSVVALHSDERVVFVHPRMSGPYPPDVVLILFSPGSALSERREAVRRIEGTVVAGDGSHYYVRVGLECADLPVWCAVDRLAGLPQVEYAAPLDMGYGPLGND